MIQVHVFPTQPAQQVDFAAQCLCEADQRQLSTLHSESRRNLFLYSRKKLYGVLSHTTGMPASTLSIGLGPHGKPLVENAPGFLDFSISHSKAFLAIAVSKNRRVGIDIEDTATRGPAPTLESVCSESELKQLALLPKVNFLEIWTKKEAFLKLNGVGLAVDPKAVEAKPDGFVSCPSGHTLVHRRARLALFTSNPFYVMSVAYPALRGDRPRIELNEEHCL